MVGPERHNIKEPEESYLTNKPIGNEQVIRTCIQCGSCLLALIIMIIAIVYCLKGQTALAELGSIVKAIWWSLHDEIIKLVGLTMVYGLIGANLLSWVFETIKEKFTSLKNFTKQSQS